MDLYYHQKQDNLLQTTNQINSKHVDNQRCNSAHIQHQASFNDLLLQSPSQLVINDEQIKFAQNQLKKSIINNKNLNKQASQKLLTSSNQKYIQDTLLARRKAIKTIHLISTPSSQRKCQTPSKKTIKQNQNDNLYYTNQQQNISQSNLDFKDKLFQKFKSKIKIYNNENKSIQQNKQFQMNTDEDLDLEFLLDKEPQSKRLITTGQLDQCESSNSYLIGNSSIYQQQPQYRAEDQLKMNIQVHPQNNSSPDSKIIQNVQIQNLKLKLKEANYKLNLINTDRNSEPKDHFNIIGEDEQSIAAINRVLTQVQQLHAILEKKVSLINHLARQLTSITKQQNLRIVDVQTLQDSIDQITQCLIKFSQNEQDANYFYRDLEKCKLQLSKTMGLNDNMNKKIHAQNQTLIKLKEQVQKLTEDNVELTKNWRKEEEKSHDLERQNNNIIDRLELIQNSEKFARKQDKVQQILNTLLIENDQLKKKIYYKKREIDKLNVNVNNLKDKIDRLTRKVILLSKNYEKHEIFDDQNQQNQQDSNLGNNNNLQKSIDLDQQRSNELIIMLQNQMLPQSMDDWILKSGYKREYVSLMMDVLESNAKIGVDAILTTREPIEKLNLITTFLEQFQKLKLMMDQMNKMIYKIIEISKINNMQDLQVNIAKRFQSIFDCRTVHLWLIDSCQLIFYTYNQDREKITAKVNKGIFKEIIQNKNPVIQINSKAIFLYQNDIKNEQKYVDGLIAIPLIIQTQLIGILEISQFQRVNNDYQKQLNATYFSLILQQLCKNFQHFLRIHQLLKLEQQYHSIFQDTFIQLIKCTSINNFAIIVQNQGEKIFSTLNCRLFLMDEQGELTMYDDQQGFIKSMYSKGSVAKQVAESLKSEIIINIQTNSNYCDHFDLQTTLPVYCFPIVFSQLNEDIEKQNNNFINNTNITVDFNNNSQQCFGVIEIVLNNNITIQDLELYENLYIKELLSPSESIERLAKHFSEIVSISLFYLKSMKFDKNKIFNLQNQ